MQFFNIKDCRYLQFPGRRPPKRLWTNNYNQFQDAPILCIVIRNQSFLVQILSTFKCTRSLILDKLNAINIDSTIPIGKLCVASKYISKTYWYKNTEFIVEFFLASSFSMEGGTCPTATRNHQTEGNGESETTALEWYRTTWDHKKIRHGKGVGDSELTHTAKVTDWLGIRIFGLFGLTNA